MDDVTRLVERLNNELGWGIGPAMLCQEAAAALQAQAAEIEQLREIAKSYKGDAIDTLAKLREAVEVIRPFAAISREGVVTTKTGHVRLTTCAEYFHEADAFLATMEKTDG